MNQLIVLALLITSAVYAQAADPCLDTLEKKFVTEAESQDWGFDRIIPTTQENAVLDLNEALWDMNDEATLEQAKVVASKPGNLYYALNWTAPSNEGYNIVIATPACEVLFNIGVWSQE